MGRSSLNRCPPSLVVGKDRDWTIQINVRVQIMDIVTMQSDDIVVIRDRVKGRTQLMRGGEKASIVPKSCLPISFRDCKLRKINTRVPPPEGGGMKNTVGKPRHKHDFIFGTLWVSQGVPQKLHAARRGELTGRAKLWGGLGSAPRHKSVRGRSVSRVENAVVVWGL